MTGRKSNIANMRRGVAAFWLAGVLVSAAMNAQAAKLSSPWDGLKVAVTNMPYACPAPPAFSRSFEVEGYYTDKHASVIDPKKLAAFNAETAGPTHLGQFTTRAADKYLESGSRAAAVCVYSLLDAAAKANAWDETMPQIAGTYIQNWMLSGTAIAYLKVRSSGVGTAAEDVAIQKWFQAIAARVREYFEMHRLHPGSDAYNNHMYWAGLSVAAEGIANNDADAFLWGLATYLMGVDAIEPDGSLTAEMDRAGMAEHYQLYALGPLVMLAELAAANGVDLYAIDDGAIHKLVKFSVAGLEDPSIIEKRTGVKQDLPAEIAGLEIGWAVPYVQRFPHPQISALLAKAQWVNFWQWGGAPPQAVIPMPQATGAIAEWAFGLRDRKLSFLGEWCGQGNPANHASIRAEGSGFVLDNGMGSSSSGQSQGKNVIVAPEWQSVVGVLTEDGSQINWSNNSFWARCDASIAAGKRSAANLTGIWSSDGVQTLFCAIRQTGNELLLRNESGFTARGRIDGKHSLASNWMGTRINAKISADGKRITWENGGSWTRYEAPGSKNK